MAHDYNNDYNLNNKACVEYCQNNVGATKAFMNSFYGLTGRCNGKRDVLDSMMYAFATSDRKLHHPMPFTFSLYITNVIFNPPATIVFWSDNTKTVVQCNNEEFDPEKGLAMAIAKKSYGNKGNYFNNFKKWLDKSEQKFIQSRYKIGDKISIDLGGMFGTQTATAQKVNEDGSVIFLFDNILANHPMNRDRTNQGGFYKSDLNSWIQNTLRPAFPKGIQIREISIPTYGQIFGHDERWYHDVFAPDHDERWSLMKQQENRRAKYQNDYDWYWLQNATKKDISAAYFAIVNLNGYAFADGASYSHGVRPCFTIEPPCGDK